jgi:hypothetical protein
MAGQRFNSGQVSEWGRTLSLQSYPSGTTFWLPGQTVTSQTNNAIAANFLFFGGLLVEAETRFTGLSVYVNNGVASSNVRLGIYNANDLWVPTTVVLDSGDVATTSSGLKDWANNFTLMPGRYLTAIVSNSNPTLSFWQGTRHTGGTSISSNGFSLTTVGSLSFTYGALTNNPGTPSLTSNPTGLPVLPKVA